MLSFDNNELTRRLDPATPLGNLARRYWIPALPSDEFPAGSDRKALSKEVQRVVLG
jgi:hypothetical protein